jgi:hypothetical protein
MINEGHFDGVDAFEQSTKSTEYSIGKAGMPTYSLHKDQNNVPADYLRKEDTQ